MKTSKSRKCWWKRLRSLQSDLAHCLRQPGSDKKAVRLNTITNALRGLAGSEPEILHVQLPGLEEQLEAMGRTSATTPVGDSLIDALCSRVEAEDQHCNFLLQEEQGAVEDRARDELKHASNPVDERVLRMAMETPPNRMKALLAVFKMLLQSPSIHRKVHSSYVRRCCKGVDPTEEECATIATLVELLRPYIPKRRLPESASRSQEEELPQGYTFKALPHVVTMAPFIILADATLHIS
ncbi:hypothetical protein BGX30_007572, partial [Mortierella sp. GBA39]